MAPIVLERGVVFKCVLTFAVVGCSALAHTAHGNEASGLVSPAWEPPPLFEFPHPRRILFIDPTSGMGVLELEEDVAVVAPRFGDFGKALGYNFTKGLFARENLIPVLVGVGATLAAKPFDEEVSDALRDSSGGWGDVGQVAGGVYVVAGSTAGLLLATPFVKNQKYRAFTFSLAQAVILNNALAFGVKLVVTRTRPDESGDDSFPSAHASNSFAWATVAARHFGTKVAIPAYIVAGAIALSRVERGSHWLSDVVAGSAIGFIAGITAARGTKHFANQRQWTLLPSFGRRHVGLQLHWRF